MTTLNHHFVPAAGFIETRVQEHQISKQIAVLHGTTSPAQGQLASGPPHANWCPIRKLPGSNGLQGTPVSTYPEHQHHHRSDEQNQCRHAEHAGETEPGEYRSYENRCTDGSQPAHCRCQTDSRRTDARRKDLGSV